MVVIQTSYYLLVLGQSCFPTIVSAQTYDGKGIFLFLTPKELREQPQATNWSFFLLHSPHPICLKTLAIKIVLRTTIGG